MSKKSPQLFTPKVFGEFDPKKLDEAFKDGFSLEALDGELPALDEFLSAKGWVLGGPPGDERPVKDGVYLNSPEAYLLDRAAAQAMEEYYLRRQLGEYIASATPEQLRVIRIAWESGAATAEAHLYLSEKRGRKEEASKIYEAIEAAYSKWKKRNPNLDRKPKASELEELYVGFGPDIGGSASFANRVSEWWQLMHKSSEE